MSNFNTFQFYVWLLLINIAFGTLSPTKKAHKSKELNGKKGPIIQNVFQLNLVGQEQNVKDILLYNAAYSKDTHLRHFNGTVLGYVTPWNSHGYDIAKVFAKKFDIMSPVWLQVVPKHSSYEIAGLHDVDIKWLADVRRRGKSPDHTVKIYPRIILDHFNDKDIERLLNSDEQRNKLNSIIVRQCKEHGFDGIVLELWSQLAGRVESKFLYALVKQLSKDLHENDLGFIITIPPKRKNMPNLFSQTDFEKLNKYVDGFSLMTYDYSSLQRPGANAPLYWVRAAVEELVPNDINDAENVQIKRAKILLGLNMYGYDYTPDGGGAITFSRYLELIKYVKKVLTYDERDVEHFFEVRTTTGRHIVFYPSLYSINERIKLAKELGVGISIWELGQGLNNFYDLF